MKRNFNKEFKEEFKKSFDNGLNKDTLKENLNLVPKEDTITFKKKPFYGLSSLFAALLIIVTASITWLVIYYADCDRDNFHCQSEEVDAVKFYEDMYKQGNVSLVCKVNTPMNLVISFVDIKYDNLRILGMYFHGENKIHNEYCKYNLKVNECWFEGTVLQQNSHTEYVLKKSSNYQLCFEITCAEMQIFYFCTNF